MSQINFKRLVSQKESLYLIHSLVSVIDTQVNIQTADGQLLMGEASYGQSRYPVEVDGEVVGWVFGPPKAAAIASLLTYLATQELEKKTLAKEVLDKYREINLFYALSEKLNACLDVEEIATLIILEAKKLIHANNISVMLLDLESQKLEVAVADGKECEIKAHLMPGIGIGGCVLLNGKAEIVNNVWNDPRFVPGENAITSLICAPLKTQNGCIGLINISSEEAVNYKAQDLKLATSLALIAATAIENAMLHKNKLKEERIKSQLERYIPPQLVNAIITAKEGDISLAPAKKNIAILFSDIRNFTTKCEELPPEMIVGYLNEYFTQMVDVIFSHEGTVNKFVGDMIVAMFGAPAKLVNNEKQAIEAAIGMQLRLRNMSINWIKENFLTGIGITSGEVVIGNIGSPQHLDYTAIGDEVNLASRLQGLAQGGQILVSANVYEVTRDSFTYREVGNVTVKGKRKSVDVFEVIY
ncbi:guanylate cyclase [Oscillatoriales cyanobacterium USR001]|nr:guanylate cyclase [Oscillatoriales cyanobacterium USR001]